VIVCALIPRCQSCQLFCVFLSCGLRQALTWGAMNNCKSFLTKIHGVCFAGIGSSLPPTERVTKKWGPRPSRRGRSADDSDADVATRDGSIRETWLYYTVITRDAPQGLISCLSRHAYYRAYDTTWQSAPSFSLLKPTPPNDHKKVPFGDPPPAHGVGRCT